MHYTVYKTTNLINGKIYIGAHKTNNLDDGYLGSGLILKHAIKKYGIENFEKEILAVFDKSSDMFNMESELVNEEFVSDKSTYNLKLGGEGGFDYINSTGKNLYGKNGQSGHGLENLKIGHDSWNEQTNTKLSKSLKIYYKDHDGSFIGKKHTDETKKKIGESNSIKQKGSGNSQFGTMWITNETESKKINKELPIPEGWRKGRVI
jgi:hypothetical protein